MQSFDENRSTLKKNQPHRHYVAGIIKKYKNQ